MNDYWRDKMNEENLDVQIGKAFNKALFNSEEHRMNMSPYTRFTYQREMVRDYDRELEYCDGFAYWCTTGRLIVTWYDGSKTIIDNKDMLIDAKVVDCGYDEGLPF